MEFTRAKKKKFTYKQIHRTHCIIKKSLLSDMRLLTSPSAWHSLGPVLLSASSWGSSDHPTVVTTAPAPAQELPTRERQPTQGQKEAPPT